MRLITNCVTKIPTVRRIVVASYRNVSNLSKGQPRIDSLKERRGGRSCNGGSRRAKILFYELPFVLRPFSLLGWSFFRSTQGAVVTRARY